MIPVLLNDYSFRFTIYYHTIMVLLFLFIQNKLLKPETLIWDDRWSFSRWYFSFKVKFLFWVFENWHNYLLLSHKIGPYYIYKEVYNITQQWL